jgi:putative DNA methylase
MKTPCIGRGAREQGEVWEEEIEEDEEEDGKTKKISGFTLEYDAARKIAQGLGVHLEQLSTLVEIKGDKARLLPVTERANTLMGKIQLDSRAKTKKKEDLTLIPGIEAHIPEDSPTPELELANLGKTILDRIHQTMLLFGAGRSEAIKRFLVDEGVGSDERFWKLANALSALYPVNTEEKRWIDGVLARKKGLGL